MAHLGVGIGWRPEIADAVDRLDGLDWVEVVAENICPGHLPEALQRLRERGTRIVPHGVSLGLGGADRPDPQKLAALGERAVALGAPLVTEHIAFVRTSSPVLEAGHLLPVPRTRDALDVLCENVRIAQDALPVPLALENIAALFSWPGEEMTEGRFLTELVERTGVRLLIDVANLHTNRVNRGEDPAAVLDAIPLEALAYVHVAGGVERDGVWHDTHAHPVPPVVLDLLAELRSRVEPAGVLLERDDDFPPEAELAHELATIREVVTATARKAAPKPGPVPEPKKTAAVPHTGAGARAAEPATGAQPEARPQAEAGLGSEDGLEPHAEARPQPEAGPGPQAGAGTGPEAGA
ncbi:multinuclear nonheme iron-dependent oxidase, partial [Streptomyces erythrochromogenes]|uniref:multinuclear nonheme iron-dependent oxidase n=1 Tax=Streptomyces erythrochromogenes TaxID=285574 RepID=UPI0036C9BE8F